MLLHSFSVSPAKGVVLDLVASHSFLIVSFFIDLAVEQVFGLSSGELGENCCSIHICNFVFMSILPLCHLNLLYPEILLIVINKCQFINPRIKVSSDREEKVEWNSLSVFLTKDLRLKS